MDAVTFERCLRRIRSSVQTRDAAVKRLYVLGKRDPFRIAVRTLLSPRTRDATLVIVLERLFLVIHTPKDILKLSPRRLQSMLRPTGFFRMKARALRRFAAALIEQHDGHVPNTMDELLALPGVGPKIAGVIMTAAHGQDAIAVDTHVHRIVNRLGLARTLAPGKTAAVLYSRLPQRLWRHVNVNLVALGQTVCLPIRPQCARCPLDDLCPKIGVRHGPTLPPRARRRRRQGRSIRCAAPGR